MKPNHVKWLLLGSGAALIAAAHMRWGIGALAWIAPVPLLVALRRAERWRDRWLVVAALYLGFALATAKIATAPLSPAFALLFALPVALLQAAAYLLWDRVRRGGHETLALLS